MVISGMQRSCTLAVAFGQDNGLRDSWTVAVAANLQCGKMLCKNVVSGLEQKFNMVTK